MKIDAKDFQDLLKRQLGVTTQKFQQDFNISSGTFYRALELDGSEIKITDTVKRARGLIDRIIDKVNNRKGYEEFLEKINKEMNSVTATTQGTTSTFITGWGPDSSAPVSPNYEKLYHELIKQYKVIEDELILTRKLLTIQFEKEGN